MPTGRWHGPPLEPRPLRDTLIRNRRQSKDNPNAMIRTSYLMTSFLVAVLLSGLGLASLSRYVGYQGIINNWHWVMAEIDHGNLRLGISHWGYRGFLQNRRTIRVRPQAHLSLGPLGRATLRYGIGTGNWKYFGVDLPLWAFVAGLLIHPAFAFFRGPVRRRRRLRRNQCLHCGYDRTGNTSGTCPECGTRYDPQPPTPATPAPSVEPSPTR